LVYRNLPGVVTPLFFKKEKIPLSFSRKQEFRFPSPSGEGARRADEVTSRRRCPKGG